MSQDTLAAYVGSLQKQLADGRSSGGPRTWRDYVSAMRAPKAFAGTVEIIAFTKLYPGFRVHVLTEVGKDANPGEGMMRCTEMILGDGPESIFLLHDAANSVSPHYDVLAPVPVERGLSEPGALVVDVVQTAQDAGNPTGARDPAGPVYARPTLTASPVYARPTLTRDPDLPDPTAPPEWSSQQWSEFQEFRARTSVPGDNAPTAASRGTDPERRKALSGPPRGLRLSSEGVGPLHSIDQICVFPFLKTNVRVVFGVRKI